MKPPTETEKRQVAVLFEFDLWRRSNQDMDIVVACRGPDLLGIVRAVNAIGAAPSDLVAILEALKQAGALRAELEVI